MSCHRGGEHLTKSERERESEDTGGAENSVTVFFNQGGTGISLGSMPALYKLLPFVLCTSNISVFNVQYFDLFKIDHLHCRSSVIKLYNKQ